MHYYLKNTTLITFSGMFVWWAFAVLYYSLRWEGIRVYLVGLLPALGVCLISALVIDRIVTSPKKRATIAWGLNIAMNLLWLFGTEAAARTRGIEFGVDGPFMIGGAAIMVNFIVLLIIQYVGIAKIKK